MHSVLGATTFDLLNASANATPLAPVHTPLGTLASVLFKDWRRQSGGEFAVDTPPPSADFWKKQGVSVKTFFIKDFLSKNIFRRAGKRGVSIELSSDTNFNLDNSQIWKKKRVVFSFGGETDYHCSIECSLGFDWTFCQNDR